MIYSAIKTLVYQILGDSEASPKIFTSTMIDAFANMTISSLNEEKILRKRQAVPVVAGTQEYALPTNCRQPFRVTYDGTKIAPVTTSYLDNYCETWRDESGTPYAYYLKNGMIGLYPKPTVSSSLATLLDAEYGVVLSDADQEFGVIVDTSVNDGLNFDQEEGVYISSLEGDHLEVFYWAEPVSASGALSPDVPDWADPAVVLGILALCYAADTFDRDFEKANAYTAMFEDVKRRISVRSSNILPKVYRQKEFAGPNVLLYSDRRRRKITVPGS